MSLRDARPSSDGPVAARGSNGEVHHLAGRQRLAAVDSPEVDVDAPPAEEVGPRGAPEAAEPVQPIAGQRGDDEAEVRALAERRPVPPSAAPATTAGAQPSRPIDDLPVYDPFSARRRRSPEWQVTYTATLAACDIAAAALAVVCASMVGLTDSRPGYLLAAAAVLLWPAVLGALGTYAECRQGTGSVEYRRVVEGGLIGLAGLGVGAALRPGEGLGRLLLVGVPVATLLTLLGRAWNRRRLHRARRRGLMAKRAVVVGPPGSALDLVHRVRRDVTVGLRVVGACVPDPAASGPLQDAEVPVLGGLDEVVQVLDRVRADAVLVSAASETAGHYLRDLAWRLEGTNIELLVGPGVIEVSPSRLAVRPTSSMPLIRIQEPEFRGFRRLAKGLVDRLAAALLLLLLAPLGLAIACAIRLTSPGPVLYRHRRIGKCGREFDLLKFRSMVSGADRQIEALMAFNEGNEVQFKLRQDPRVTRIGGFLRRYSLDELPQLINVLKGDMSLVGPRPHVTREVEQYGADMQRRLLVRPGITGLWQVSGRSNLAWDEAVEIDVRYVENWSIGLDISILWRTVREVIRSSGAY